MIRARTVTSKRSLKCRFKTQEVSTQPLPSSKVKTGGPPPKLWKAGSVDIEYDLDPTAGADPVESWSKTVTDRPDGSQHVVARVFYPATTEGESQSRQPYMPHLRYAYGISEFLMSRSRNEWWYGFVTSVVSLCIYLIGCEESYPAEPGRKLADDIDELPVVILSHGIGSNRYLYSTLCSYLATHGFVVVAVEHTDGLASAAKPAGDRKWMFYKGWGDKEYLMSCSRHREQEVATCMRALSAISLHGANEKHVSASCVRGSDEIDDILDGFKGRLDLQHIVLMGHSYGGATAAGVGSVDSVDDSGVGKAACVVMYDPWYPAIPCESPARSQWLSGCPSLVLGSVSFNTESEKGIIYAEGEDVGLQTRVLRACASGSPATSGDALAGATLLVPNDSQHSMVDDLGAVMLDRYAWFFRLMGRKRQSDQITGKDMAERCYDATLAFLLKTVPLSPAVHSCASHHLSSRWAHLPSPDSLVADQEDEGIAAGLRQFFEASRCDPSDSDLAGPGHGCLVCEDFKP